MASNRFNSGTPGAQTVTDVWITPPEIIDAIGLSDLDPCGYLPDGKPLVETARRYYTEEDDGLIQPWEGTVFCNPPYSDLATWMEKCASYHLETGKDVILLAFARTDTRTFQAHARSATSMNFLSGRVKFLDANGNRRQNPNAASVLIAWGVGASIRASRLPGIVVAPVAVK
jgi:phage N-6-adenine-methyltransferase